MLFINGRQTIRYLHQLWWHSGRTQPAEDGNDVQRGQRCEEQCAAERLYAPA